MSRVLVVGMTSNPGGLESVIINYVKNIDHNKVIFDFLCTTDKIAYEKEIKEYGGDIYNITAKSKDYFKYKKELKSFFQKQGKEYDSVWVNMNSITNLDYLKLAKKYNVKHRIIHSHNSKSMYHGIKSILHFFNRLFIKKYATDYWACSLGAGKWFYNDKIINSNNFKIINNAIDVNNYAFNTKKRNEIRNKYNIGDNEILIGHVGRFEEQKNHDKIIDIFNEICKKNSNYKLILIGKGSLEEKIKTKVKDLGLKEKVIFTGAINNVNEYYSAMDLFLFPSLYEGLSVVLVEVQASGLNVFSSNVMEDSVKITDLYHEYSLEEPNNVWADEILKSKIIKDRCIYSKKISESIYNIQKESKKMEDFFLDKEMK